MSRPSRDTEKTGGFFIGFLRQKLRSWITTHCIAQASLKLITLLASAYSDVFIGAGEDPVSKEKSDRYT